MCGEDEHRFVRLTQQNRAYEWGLFRIKARRQLAFYLPLPLRLRVYGINNPQGDLCSCDAAKTGVRLVILINTN